MSTTHPTPMENAEPSTTPPFPPVDLASLRLLTDDRGRLFVVRDGYENQQIIVRRAFPWSITGQFVSVRNKDGSELTMIESLDSIPADARAKVLSALEQGTFIPAIRRITRINLEHGYQLWDVETDSGSLQLRVQEREDVRFLSETRFTVKDANGNVFEIADVRALDEQSQRELSRVV